MSQTIQFVSQMYIFMSEKISCHAIQSQYLSTSNVTTCHRDDRIHQNRNKV